jgi:hypothetical protein
MLAVSIGCDALSPLISFGIETLDVWRSRAPISIALSSRWADPRKRSSGTRESLALRFLHDGEQTDTAKKAAVSANRRPIRESQ